MYIRTSISEIERITQEVFSIKAPNAEQSLQTGITSWAHDAANLLGFYMKETENRVDSWYGLLGCRWECRGLRKLWAGCNGHSRCKVWTMGQRVLVHTQRGRSPHVLQTVTRQPKKDACVRTEGKLVIWVKDSAHPNKEFRYAIAVWPQRPWPKRIKSNVMVNILFTPLAETNAG